MSKLNDFLQERARVYDSMKVLQDKYADKPMEGSEADTYGNLTKEFDSLTEKIENAKKDEERARLMAEQQAKAEKAKKPETESLFAKVLQGNARAIEQYRNEAVQMTLGTDATAGYLTAPVEFRQELIKGLDNDVFMRRISRNVGTIGNAQSLGFPYRAADADDASWVSEIAATVEEENLAYGRREFKPNRLTKLIKLSKTLVNHSAMAERTILDELGYRVGITQESAYMTGNGTGKPLGIFVASDSGIAAGRDVSADNTTTAVTIDGLLNAKYSLKAQYQRNAQWVMHRDLVKMIAKLKDGEGQYIWQPAVDAGQPDRLLGCPINMSEYAPNTYTTGQYAAVIGDFRYYWIADGDALNIQVLDQLFATYNLIGYLCEYFGDGAPVLGEAFARVKLA